MDVPEAEMLVQPHQPHFENSPKPKIVKMTKTQKLPAEIVKINQNLEIETSSQSGSDYSQRPLPEPPSHQNNLPSTSQSGQNHQKNAQTSQGYTKVNKNKVLTPKISICDEDGCHDFDPKQTDL